MRPTGRAPLWAVVWVAALLLQSVALSLAQDGRAAGEETPPSDISRSLALPSQSAAEAKIARLREASRELAALAQQPTPAGVGLDEQKRAAAYAQWLEAASARLDELADRWDAARRTRLRRQPGTTAAKPRDSVMPARAPEQEMNQSFSMQYVALQQKIQQENREFTLLSNILEAKHEAAKNAINNVR